MTRWKAGLARRGTIGAVTIGAMLAVAAAQRLPDGGPDIVVTGGVPVMVAGLWRFQSGTTLVDPMPGMRAARPRRGEDFTRCIRDGDTRAILDQLVGRVAAFGSEGLCTALRVSIDRDQVNGSRRCQLVAAMTPDGDLVGRHVDTRLRATITPTSLAARYTSQTTIRGVAGPKARWQLRATRVGSCEAPSPPTARPAITHSDAATPEEPFELATPPLAPGPVPTATATATGTATTDPPQADDIVVIGRKLRRLRLHYASSGRAFRWCHADVSSGDARLDRIGCAIVRTCVRSGFDDPASALACFHRRVDTLDKPPPPPSAAGQRR